MDRRNFLRRSTIALAGGLLVGDAALEAFERLNHSKVFALGGIDDALRSVYRKTNGDIMVAMKNGTEEFEWVDTPHHRLAPPGQIFLVEKRVFYRMALPDKSIRATVVGRID